MRSLKNRILLYFSCVWLVMTSLFSFASYLFYRQTMLRIVDSIGENSGNALNLRAKFGIETWQRYTSNSEIEYLKSFFDQYQYVIILFVAVGLILLIISLLSLDTLLRNMVQNIVDLLVVEQRAGHKDKLPSEFEVVAESIDGYKAEVLALHEQNERFQSYASHELRNELAILSGLMQEYKIKEPALLEHQQQLEYIVEDLLILSYVPEQLAMEEVDIFLVLAEVVDQASRYATIDLEIIGEDIASIYAKEGWIRRMLKNIIDNAIRYRLPQSEVMATISVRNNTVFISIVNEIKDKSLTMLPQEIKGHGIGLKLVKHVVETIHGIYDVEVMDGKVTTTLNFPIIQ